MIKAIGQKDTFVFNFTFDKNWHWTWNFKATAKLLLFRCAKREFC